MNNIRRNQKKLPSIKKHGLSAILLLAIIIVSTWAWLNFKAKNSTPPMPSAEVKINPLAEIPNQNSEKNKSANNDAMPDLLAEDNIPIDENPTENIKLVGEPKQEANKNNKKVVRKNGKIYINNRPLSSIKSGREFTSLPPAPVLGLSKKTDFGEIPFPNNKGLSPLIAYAKPFKPKDGEKYISIIVGGLGLNPSLTRRAITELPAEISLSFAAHAPGLQGWINQARKYGHEVLIEIPMDKNDADIKMPLSASNNNIINIRNLEYNLSRAQGYFALTNYGGDALLQDKDRLLPIVEKIAQSGLGFVYDGSIGDAMINPLGRKHGLAVLKADAIIDENSQDSILVYEQIEKLNRLSNNQIAVGMGFGFGGTIDGIKIFIAAKDENLQIAPVSYALKNR